MPVFSLGLEVLKLQPYGWDGKTYSIARLKNFLVRF